MIARRIHKQEGPVMLDEQNNAVKKLEENLIPKLTKERNGERV